MNLNDLFYQSGLSVRDFAKALGIDNKTIERMLAGKVYVKPEIIGDAAQLVADIAYVESIIDHNPRLQNISYITWKKALAYDN